VESARTRPRPPSGRIVASSFWTDAPATMCRSISSLSSLTSPPSPDETAGGRLRASGEYPKRTACPTIGPEEACCASSAGAGVAAALRSSDSPPELIRTAAAAPSPVETRGWALIWETGCRNEQENAAREMKTRVGPYGRFLMDTSLKEKRIVLRENAWHRVARVC